MKALLNKYSRSTNPYNVPVTDVQGGLAMTPTEMLQSCNAGVPISAQMLADSNFDDGEVSRLTDVPYLCRRGIDVGDVQAYEESCRSKVKSAYSKTE